jgi:serine/threonine protein phosphatase PrpC
VTTSLSAEPSCPACHLPVIAGDRFCEACGAPLAPSTEQPPQVAPAGTCASCGATAAVGADGYCQQCGYKQPDPHDHEEADLGFVAGITDRGLHHHRNEDSMALSSPRADTAVAVVCDGVSSSANADQAAKAAAAAALGVLTEALSDGSADGASRADDLADVMCRGVAAAQAAVLGVARNEAGDSPSCTFVGVATHGPTVTIGWMGDSRVYWLGAGDDRRLTIDDSWAAEQVTAGTMTDEEAEADERAHSITRWLGADTAEVLPHTVTFSPRQPGRVLICTDGLWNYASSAARLGDLLAELPSSATPLAAARHLTNFARDQGGHDNITVVIIAL